MMLGPSADGYAVLFIVLFGMLFLGGAALFGAAMTSLLTLRLGLLTGVLLSVAGALLLCLITLLAEHDRTLDDVRFLVLSAVWLSFFGVMGTGLGALPAAAVRGAAAAVRKRPTTLMEHAAPALAVYGGSLLGLAVMGVALWRMWWAGL